MTNIADNTEQPETQDTPQLAQEAPEERLAALEKVVQNARKLERQAVNSLKQYEELGVTPDKIREMMEAQKKQQLSEAEKRGEYETIVKKMREEHAKEVERHKAEATQFKTAYQAGVVQTQLMQELVTAGATPGGTKALPTLLQNRLRIDNVDGSLAVRVLDANGEVMVTAKGEAGIADLVQEAIQEYPELFKAPVKSGSGKQPGSVAGSASSKTVTRSQFDGMSQFERAKFVREGGKVAGD